MSSLLEERDEHVPPAAASGDSDRLDSASLLFFFFFLKKMFLGELGHGGHGSEVEAFRVRVLREPRSEF